MFKLTNITIPSLLLACTAGGAHAAVDTTRLFTGHTDLKFTAPVTITNTLDSDGPNGGEFVAGSLAGDTAVATGTLDVSQASHVAIRWGAGAEAVDSNTSAATVSGKSDATHKLALQLTAAEDWPAASILAGGWLLIPGNASTSYTYGVTAYNDQDVKADTYTVNVDAAIYTP